MPNEYTSDEQPEYKRKYKAPEPGSEQYQRRKCQSWLKILGKNPKANSQDFLIWAGKKAKKEAPDYWITHLKPAFALKWKQNERAEEKAELARDSEKEN